jgi:phenylpropionate dioxygenase-like ring-hydroxylating dioxygenase large terminal subunit
MTESQNGKFPTEGYVSRKFFEREKANIWHKTWLLAGRAADVVTAGQFVVFDIEVVNTSVLVVRHKDGELKAFLNMCKHRGHKLAQAPAGKTTVFVCPFHAWCYNTDGRLRGKPWESTFSELCADDTALTAVSVDTWGGFIFVNLEHSPAESLRSFLRGMPAAVEPYLRERAWEWVAGNKTPVEHNWKMAVDAGAEAYHASFLHKKTFDIALDVADSTVTEFGQGGGVLARLTVRAPRNIASSQPSVVQAMAAKHSALSQFFNKDLSGIASDTNDALNAGRDPRWIFDAYVIFPNIFLILQANEFNLSTSWPTGPHTARLIWDNYHLGHARNFGELFARMQKGALAPNVRSEDIYAAEVVQKSLLSERLSEIFLSTSEQAIRIYQDVLRAAVGE